MTLRKVSFLQGVDGARYQLPAEDHRLNHAGFWTPDTSQAPLAVRSGVVWGPGTPGAVTVVAGGLSVTPFHAVIQGTVNGVQGPYEVTSDAAEFRAVVAGSPTEFRRGLLIARVRDRISAADLVDEWVIEPVYGPNAATAGEAQLPALPANSVQLREFAVSNTGVITLAGPPTPRTVPRGVVLPLATEAEAAGLPAGMKYAGLTVYAEDTGATGQYDPAGAGSWLWTDSRWQNFTPDFSVATLQGGTYPAPIYGNALRQGRYKRNRRKVVVNVFIQLGSTTGYAGANQIFRVDYPAGLRPSTDFFGGFGIIRGSGSGYVAYASGAAGTVVCHEWNATEAFRRIIFAHPFNGNILAGGSSAYWNFTYANNYMTFLTEYEIA